MPADVIFASFDNAVPRRRGRGGGDVRPGGTRVPPDREQIRLRATNRPHPAWPPGKCRGPPIVSPT